MPRFSIVIPTYNRAVLVAKAIASVLGQTLADLEVIVVDDGSTDNTAQVVKDFQVDARVHYIYQPNQGRSKARNQGVRLAQGELLGFLDSDDEYLPNTLELHSEVFARQTDLGMTIGGLEYIDANGQLLGQRSPWDESDNLSLSGWLFNCYAQPATLLVRRDLFQRVGGFDAYCEIAEDWDLFLRLASKGCRFAWVQGVVCRYRQHPDNSIQHLALHRAGSLRALSKLFEQQDLDPQTASLKEPALAWVSVVFAHKALGAGDVALARENLTEAVRLNPKLLTEDKPALLETLLAPTETGLPIDPSRLQPLVPTLHLKPIEIRQAQGRVEMQSFFRARRQGAWGQAASHLRAGLKHDLRWLANRGVLSFWLKDMFHRV